MDNVDRECKCEKCGEMILKKDIEKFIKKCVADEVARSIQRIGRKKK